MFGKLVKELRAAKRLGLREFCVAVDYDPSNWSKIERGIMAPPQDASLLKRVTLALGIEEDSATAQNLVDFATIDAGRIPHYVLDDAALLKKLPIFFRTIAGRKPSREELEKLAQVLRDP